MDFPGDFSRDRGYGKGEGITRSLQCPLNVLRQGVGHGGVRVGAQALPGDGPDPPEVASLWARRGGSLPSSGV